MPQGHTRPGGCKPQAKVESVWSFSSNPFYTVKTAKLSPRRPLFNWEANRRKTKTNAQTDSFPLFSPQQKARCLAKRETDNQRSRLLASGPGVGRARGGLDGAALCMLSPSDPDISPSACPIGSLLFTGRAEAILSMQAPSCVFSLVLKGRCGHLGVGGSELEKLAPGLDSYEAGAGRAGVGTGSPGETSKRNRKHLQALLASRSFPWGKAEVGRHAARRQS